MDLKLLINIDYFEILVMGQMYDTYMLMGKF